MHRKFISCLVIFAFTFTIFAAYAAADEKTKADGIKWMGYEEGVKRASKEGKYLIVDFYTNWCGYCKKMDKETFSNKEVIDYINKNFIPIKVNAESKDLINLPDGPTDGVKLARLFSVSGYPTYWFIEPSGRKIDRVPGYAPPERFLPVLRFVGEGHYKTKSFKDFLAGSKSK